ncbi:MAG: ribonuclease E/G [Acidimicrobiaceae bacterium]|nr:ribonuclease E/G [Acidimicrobiaceae bacterium]
MTEEETKNSNNEGPVRRRRTIGGNREAEKPPIEEKNVINAPEAVENDSPKQRKRTLSADSAAQPKQSSTSSNRRTVKLGDSSVKQSDSADRRSQRPPREPKPKVGDTRRPAAPSSEAAENESSNEPKTDRKRRRRGGRNRATTNRRPGKPVEAILDDAPVTLDEAQLERRKGRERKGKPIGRYQMLVHVDEGVTHIAVLEGRSLIEHYVSRPSDDVSEIHGNIYLGKVQNVLPGMEAAFVDIATPKNAVLYRGDVTYDREDLDGDKSQSSLPKPKKQRSRFSRKQDGARIEDLLKAHQSILCQVTKNPIAHKGARLSTEVSLPGRFVVLVPNSDTYGISKRLGDRERKRLRGILDKVKPAEHGVIVRTAAQDVTAEEIERDVRRLLDQWQQINELATSAKAPSLLFREPELAVRVIREEFNKDYRGIVIDDQALYEQVKGYMEAVTPALADRIELHDKANEPLPLFEKHHVAEQLRKAVDQKVWLPSGGSLVIDYTEALTVIDVNTGKNVGKSNLEETVFQNNLEAAEEIAKQLRLRDIGGIIVIDFIDMEIRKNRDEVVKSFEKALARDKTRTHVSGISELGLVEMTRRRTGEGLQQWREAIIAAL